MHTAQIYGRRNHSKPADAQWNYDYQKITPYKCSTHAKTANVDDDDDVTVRQGTFVDCGDCDTLAVYNI